MPSIGDIDWPQVITDLEQLGMREVLIGRLVGRSRQWVLRLRRGVHPEPRFVDGCRLLRLWADAMKRPMHKAPKKERAVNA